MYDENDTAALRAELDGLVGQAIQMLLTHDSYLLTVNANERSITHRLAVHLQPQFPDYDIDCEYNRDGIEPKKLGHLSLYPGSDDEDAQTVFPDIIVHRRNTDDNLLVIEVKKSSNPDQGQTDHAKLHGYQAQLGYRAGLFIELGVGSETGSVSTQWI